MAQTADAITFEDCLVEISDNGSVWTDISGFASSVTVAGAERQAGSMHVFGDEYAVVRRGKIEPIDVTVRILYTETTSDPYDRVKAAYVGGTDMYIRWSPLGATSGDKQYTTSAGIVIAPPYPAGEAGGGEPVPFSMTLKCSSLAEADVA